MCRKDIVLTSASRFFKASQLCIQITFKKIENKYVVSRIDFASLERTSAWLGRRRQTSFRHFDATRPPPPPFPLRYRDRPTRTEIKHREKQSKRNGYTDIYQRVNIESVALPVSVPSLASSFPSISIYLHISFLLFSNILFSQEFHSFFFPFKSTMAGWLNQQFFKMQISLWKR